MRDVEVTGKSVEEAVDLALKELNASRDQVYVDVLDTGRKGLLGIGQGQARVRVRLLGDGSEDEPDEDEVEAAAMDAESALDEELDAQEEAEEEAQPVADFTSLDDLADFAAEVVEHLIDRMHIPGTVEIVEPEEPVEGEETIYLDIVGPEVGALIGRRAETLNSLQFIVNLIVAKRTGRRIRVVVDADGYRVRREESLNSLAKRMAERVLSTAEPVILEAMPANERRIVHIAVSQIDGVRTESTGEAEQRKVVILPIAAKSES